jgi:hypothetical protein
LQFEGGRKLVGHAVDVLVFADIHFEITGRFRFDDLEAARPEVLVTGRPLKRNPALQSPPSREPKFDRTATR